jgi:phosphoglycerol transferase
VISLIVLGVLIWAYQLLSVQLRVPFGYSGDGLGVAMSVKTMMQEGWVQGSNRLGAPFGQILYDFPSGGDNGNYLVLKLLSLFTSDWVLVVNSFFLLTFFSAGWSAYLCQRWMRISRIPAIGMAVLFAFAPYHFARGIGHLFLASYFVVPILVVVAIKASRGELLNRSQSNKSRLVVLVFWAALCIACGSFGAYYTVFALLAVATSCGVSWSSKRRLAVVRDGLVFASLIGIAFVANLSGSILYRRANGVNPLVAKRIPLELDVYSLRIEQMLSPVQGHFLKPFAELSIDLSESNTSELGQFLGIVGAVSFLAVIGYLVVGRYRAKEDPSDVRGQLAALVLILTLIGVAGGLSWLLWVGGVQQIRAWNRVSIVILFCVLSWAALAIDSVLRSQRANKVPKFVLNSLLVAILCVGLVDQLSYDAIGRSRDAPVWFGSDQQFFSEVEASLEPDSMVFQLPIRRFPEEPPTFKSGDYDLLRPFLNTETLRWSYGGMKGRESEWQQQIIGLAGAEFIESIVAVGFDAVLIDTQGYPDGGAAPISEISSLTGARAVTSPDGRWVFMNISSLKNSYSEAKLAQRRDELIG